MVNSVKGEVAFTSGKDRYVLVLDWNALCDLQDSIDDFANGTLDISKPTSLRKVVWAALQEHHPELTEREAGRLISAFGPDKMAERVGEAFRLAYPEANDAPPRKPAGKTQTPPDNRKARRASTSKKR